MARRRVVIVGAGQCGASAAGALRSGGFDGEIFLIGEEDEPPYERPPLSKEWLHGDAVSLLVEPEGWYAENDVELLCGVTVSAVDVAARDVVLPDGRRISYDALLVTTGGRARRLPGVAGERVHYLRTRRDAEALRERLVPGERLVVLGGGFIGCEVAATARTLGVDVLVLEAAAVPLERVLGAEIGAVIADIHRVAGVEVRTGETVESVVETPSGLRVTTDRDELECGFLLAGIGMVPNTEFLDGSGVACDNGVLVDEYCRSSVDGVYAAGDVAAHHHPLYGHRLRVEHYDNAIKQGVAVARTMLGELVPYDDPHWFWSDQYDHRLQSVGIAHTSDTAVVRGSIADRSFSVFYLDGPRVLSVFALDRPKDIVAGRKLVRSGQPVTAEQLRDESVDLRTLIPRKHKAAR
jgi:3-phenylpropionate/trans-cinnamate dioxygenase ferredoxin reductase subunit